MADARWGRKRACQHSLLLHLVLFHAVLGHRILGHGVFDIESFDMLSFFIESLDIESFEIVSFFMVSSAKAAGASASPNDKVAADRMTAVRLIMTLQSPRKASFGLATDVTLQNFGRSRRLLLTRKKGIDHKDVNESGCANVGRRKASFVSRRGDDSRAGRRVTNCLDAVTVGIQYESAVIVSVILRSKSRRSVVAPSRRERRRVESVDGGAVGSTEADMCTWNRRSHPGFAGDGEFNTDRPRCGAIIGTTAFAEINDAYEANRTEHCVVEAPATSDIGDT